MIIQSLPERILPEPNYCTFQLISPLNAPLCYYINHTITQLIVHWLDQAIHLSLVLQRWLCDNVILLFLSDFAKVSEILYGTAPAW